MTEMYIDEFGVLYASTPNGRFRGHRFRDDNVLLGFENESQVPDKMIEEGAYEMVGDSPITFENKRFFVFKDGENGHFAIDASKIDTRAFDNVRPKS